MDDRREWAGARVRECEAVKSPSHVGKPVGLWVGSGGDSHKSPLTVIRMTPTLHAPNFPQNSARMIAADPKVSEFAASRGQGLKPDLRTVIGPLVGQSPRPR